MFLILGRLDQLSEFRYENFLQSIKRLIRSSSSPLVQVVKRIEEYETVNSQSFKAASAETQNFKFHCSNRDGTVLLKNGKYADIIEVQADRSLCTIYKRNSLKPFYFEPCSSDLLQVYFINSHSQSTVEEVMMDRVHCKGMKFPYENGSVVMPLLHEEAN